MCFSWNFCAPGDSNSCLLGVHRGLGKTIQTIALIAALLQRNDVGLGDGKVAAAAHSEGVILLKKVFLILCPTSVIQNWEQEFQAWGNFKIGIFHGVNRDTVLSKIEANDLEVLALPFESTCNLFLCILLPRTYMLFYLDFLEMTFGFLMETGGADKS